MSDEVRANETWFNSLSLGEPLAVRLNDTFANRPWHRAVVCRRTDKTVWWDVPGHPGLSSHARWASKEWSLRPWTEADEAARLDAITDAKIRRWVEKNIPRTAMAGPIPLEPKVRAAMVRVLEDFGIRLD
jgi:hypothetical protein